MITGSIECLEYPLGILCRCSEYKDIVNKFRAYTPGTYYHRVLEEEVRKLGVKDSAELTRSEKQWIPIVPDLVSFKYVDIKGFFNEN